MSVLGIICLACAIIGFGCLVVIGIFLRLPARSALNQGADDGR